MDTLRNLIRLRGSKSFNKHGWKKIHNVFSIRPIQFTHLTKLSQTAGHRIKKNFCGVLCKKETLLNLPMGKKLRNMGYPESRKTGGYGDLIVIFNMKEISFIRKYSNFQDASDLKKLGFKIHKNGKVINILNKVSSLNNLITAYNTIKSKPNNINLKINLNPLNNIRKKKLENLSSELLSGRFQFKPLQQIVNSKKKKKILIVPSLIDKLVHQSIKQQLDLLFNPLFKKISYELHSKQRHHTTFNQIKIEFKRIN